MRPPTTGYDNCSPKIYNVCSSELKIFSFYISRLWSRVSILFVYVYAHLSPVADDNGGRDGIPDIWDDNLDLAAVCCCTHLSPVADDNGGRDGIPDIWDDNLDLAAVCCCTRTSAASARCIKVFLSGLSSKFLQPTHLQEPEHIIFAYNRKYNWIL